MILSCTSKTEFKLGSFQIPSISVSTSRENIPNESKMLLGHCELYKQVKDAKFEIERSLNFEP